MGKMKKLKIELKVERKLLLMKTLWAKEGKKKVVWNQKQKTLKGKVKEKMKIGVNQREK